jgi:hypothetical protein
MLLSEAEHRFPKAQNARSVMFLLGHVPFGVVIICPHPWRCGGEASMAVRIPLHWASAMISGFTLDTV